MNESGKAVINGATLVNGEYAGGKDSGEHASATFLVYQSPGEAAKALQGEVVRLDARHQSELVRGAGPEAMS